MNNEFVQEMQQLLEQERNNLEQELNAISSNDVGEHVPGARIPKFPNLGDDRLGENTQSPHEVEEYMENVDATGVLQSQRSAVYVALQGIASGTYGTCVKCKQPIPEERLRANPAADKCVACASSHT